LPRTIVRASTFTTNSGAEQHFGGGPLAMPRSLPQGVQTYATTAGRETGRPAPGMMVPETDSPMDIDSVTLLDIAGKIQRSSRRAFINARQRDD
jgi:hypothetical protein